MERLFVWIGYFFEHYREIRKFKMIRRQRVCALLTASALFAAEPFPGQKTDFHGAALYSVRVGEGDSRRARRYEAVGQRV